MRASLLALTTALTVIGGLVLAADRPPNFVVIYCDDLGYGDIGPFGAIGYQTPNLDRMAAEGMKFTDFHSAAAVCSASRVALMTGCYPQRVGILGALGPNAKVGINENEMLIPEVLKQRGYATAIFGKWHLGDNPRFLPTRHGFDKYFGLPYSNDMWPNHPTNAKAYPPLPLIEGGKVIQKMPDQTQLTTWYTERAVQFIQENKDRPFFLYVPHSMPHVPLFVSDKFKGKTERGLFGDVIAEIDWSVGQILSTLKSSGIDEHLLPSFVVLGSAKESELARARELCAGLQAGEIVLFDRGYHELTHLWDLTGRGVFFVTRPRTHVLFKVVKRRRCTDPKILADEEVMLTGRHSRKDYPQRLRRVRALVCVEGEEREMVFVTNNLVWAATSIAELYRCRWQIEAFFKQIKQTLQLADFLGHNANAVQWQLWTALLVYVLLRFQTWCSRWPHSFARLFTLLRAALWHRHDLGQLLHRYGTADGPPPRLQRELQWWLPGFAT